MTTTINVNITAEHFYSIFGQSEFVRAFSRDGVTEVLEYIEELQDSAAAEGNTIVVDWTSVFMDAGEYTDSDFVAEFIEYADEEVSENAEDIDEVVSNIIESLDRTCRVTATGSVVVFD